MKGKGLYLTSASPVEAVVERGGGGGGEQWKDDGCTCEHLGTVNGFCSLMVPSDGGKGDWGDSQTRKYPYPSHYLPWGGMDIFLNQTFFVQYRRGFL